MKGNISDIPEYLGNLGLFVIWESGAFLLQGPHQRSGARGRKGLFQSETSIQLQAASLRMCCQEGREMEASSPRYPDSSPTSPGIF